MKIVVFPADQFGCGHFRMIWPAQMLRELGHDVTIVDTKSRNIRVIIENESVKDIHIESDVVVFQRLTNRWMAQAVDILRRKGVAVVVDIDDDLNAIHPSNPAWAGLHPRNEGKRTSDGGTNLHSWHHLRTACQNASLVTVSTPSLLKIYAPHGRGLVLPNYLPDMYRDVPHVDSDEVGWPASFHSHPNDADVLGASVSRLVSEGARFRMVGDPTGAGPALGLREDPPGGGVSIDQWPGAVAALGVGIAPLADTRFNRSKSWLKPLEMSALGVPWVASPRREYERLHKMGAGIMADRPRQWYREIKRLRESESLRKEMTEAGRSIASGLMIRDHAWKWMEAWETAKTDHTPRTRMTYPV